MDIESFIITNGRSSYDYALKSLESQSRPIKITTIRDMRWIDAVNHCVTLCTSKYYIRVDDDMFLHPKYVEYIHYIFHTKKLPKTCVYVCRLWEDWQSKIAGYVKVYKTNLVKKVGGFKVNHFGKIDKPFHSTVKRNKLKVIKDLSITGLHACASWEEQQLYRKIWAENSKIVLKRPSSYLKAQKSYKKSLDKQYSLLGQLKKKNKRLNTGFHRFLVQLKG